MATTPIPRDIRAPRPWVQVAAFCQTAIKEANGALSIIRVLDRLGLAGMTPEMQPQPLQLTMVLILKSDEMRGQYRANIRCTSPLGNVTTGPEMPFLFEGEDRGIQLVLPTGVLASEPGLYWFDVLIENEIVTRVPLRVLYQRIQLPPGMTPGGTATPPGGPAH
jgi:uncharacterized protein DUF6941